MIAWLSHTLRGMCMGIADIIPGVSGGTLALILGIYERFVAAVSAIGPGMLRAVLSREFWRRFAAGLKRPGDQGEDEVGTYAGHVLFLGFLGLGIATALAVGARFIPTLLDYYPAQMKGFFFGLVMASVVIPFRMMRRRGPPHLVAFLVAAVATFVVVGLPVDDSEKARGEVVLRLAEPPAEALTLSHASLVFSTAAHGGDNVKREVAFGPLTDLTVPAGTTELTIPVMARMSGQVANLEAGRLTRVHNGPAGATVAQPAPTSGGRDPALWFIFVAGMVAISAMVLPGISGSFILLMLGLYHYVTFSVRSVLFDRDMGALTMLLVFGVALVVGITTFSRLLNWLLHRFHDVTMAALVGIMVGSLRKIWPFATVDEVTGAARNVLPSVVDATVLATIATFVCGVAIVLVLDRVGRAHAAR